MKKLLILSLLLTACGQSGTPGDASFSGAKGCSQDLPLFCDESEFCCPRGAPHYCDGYCYPEHQDRCVQEDLCTYDILKKDVR